MSDWLFILHGLQCEHILTGTGPPPLICKEKESLRLIAQLNMQHGKQLFGNYCLCLIMTYRSLTVINFSFSGMQMKALTCISERHKSAFPAAHHRIRGRQPHAVHGHPPPQHHGPELSVSWEWLRNQELLVSAWFVLCIKFLRQSSGCNSQRGLDCPLHFWGAARVDKGLWV